jgi:hypothetical protein
MLSATSKITLRSVYQNNHLLQLSETAARRLSHYFESSPTQPHPAQHSHRAQALAQQHQPRAAPQLRHRPLLLYKVRTRMLEPRASAGNEVELADTLLYTDVRGCAPLAVHALVRFKKWESYKFQRIKIIILKIYENSKNKFSNHLKQNNYGPIFGFM